MHNKIFVLIDKKYEFIKLFYLTVCLKCFEHFRLFLWLGSEFHKYVCGKVFTSAKCLTTFQKKEGKNFFIQSVTI